MITMDFLKGVLTGLKNLLRLKEITMLEKIPRFTEIHVPTLWDQLKEDKLIVTYFPDSFVTRKRVPDCHFLFTVKSKGFCYITKR